MRMALILAAAAVMAAWNPARAQQQEAAVPQPPQPPSNQPVFDMVTGDRETAWRINRVTGEVAICRIDTTGGLDSVRARCAPAALEGAAQTSQMEGDDRP